MIKEVEGDLIKMALAGKFDAIAHGVNCFCRQKSGIARQMSERFHTHLMPLEDLITIGDKSKLGRIQYIPISGNGYHLKVFNFYTQYTWADTKIPAPFNYGAFWSCLQEYRRGFHKESLGIPMIGAGLAGGDWLRILDIIYEFSDLNITIVKFKQ
jgi:O-acetyl-ADP-ribose deacetylase (regulator of RNase III)